MWDRLLRFRRLSRDEQLLFLRAAILLPLISLSLRARGFAATQKRLRRFLRDEDMRPDKIEKSEEPRVERAVRAAARHGFGSPTCLEQSLALWWLLGRRGIPSELRIGVRKKGEELEAHAWVEQDGAALNEPEGAHRHYEAFDAGLSRFLVEKR